MQIYSIGKPEPDELLYGYFRYLTERNALRSPHVLLTALKDGTYDDREYKTDIPLCYIPGMDALCRNQPKYVKADDILGKMTPLYQLFPLFTRGQQAQRSQLVLLRR